MVNPPDAEYPPKPELTAQGWVRRFMAGPVRTREAVELYKSMGYEVHLEPVEDAELQEVCQGCALATHFFVTLYTRRPGDPRLHRSNEEPETPQ